MSRWLGLAFVFVCLHPGSSPARAQDDVELELAHERYSLDAFARRVEPTGPMRCPKVPLVAHAGGPVRWKRDLEVHPDFVARLTQFEQVVAAVAKDIYGRAPARIAHLGSFNCRRIRRYPDLLSEHGLGNAVDVSAFEFDALPKRERESSRLPRALTRRFTVSVEAHWDAPEDREVVATHRRFLRALTAALEARPDIFRVMLGPAYPGHRDHFHFDCAPYRLIVL